MTEISVEVKRQAILEAAKVYPKSYIDVRGRGTGVKGLETGKRPISDRKVNEMYENVLRLKPNQGLDKNYVGKLDKSDSKVSQNQLQTLIESNRLLESRVKALEEKLDKIMDKEQDREQKKVLGFSIVQKPTSTGGKKYLKWYGVRSIAGKQKWVYIGNDLSEAEQKIRDAVEKWAMEDPGIVRYVLG